MNRLFFHRDISTYTLFSVFTSLTFEVAILFPFLGQKGLANAQITYLFSIYALAVIIFEYLTGVLADWYTRKATLVLSTVSLILGEAFFLLGTGMPYFAVGISLIALSTAARSGADVAYLYDKLFELGRPSEFDDVLSHLGSLTLLVSIVASLVGPALTAWGMGLPFYATIFCYLLALGTLLFFGEPPRPVGDRSARLVLGKSLRTAVNNKMVLGFIWLSILIFPCYHLLTWLLQPYLQTMGVPVVYFGVFYTLISLFQAGGTRFAAALNRRFRSEQLLAGVAFVILVGLALLALPWRGMAYLAPALMGLAFGVYYPVNTIVVNRHISSDIRASLLSLQHALAKLMQMALFALVGWSMQYTALQVNFLIVAILLALGVSVVLVVFRHNFSAPGPGKR